MPSRILLLLLALCFLMPEILYSQSRPEKYVGPIRPIVYYGTGKDTNINIPAPEGFLRRLKSDKTNNAQFVVSYHNFPANAQTAFQYALDIWSSLIYTPIPIRVDAYYESLGSGILGSTNPGNFYKFVEGALQFNAFYPVAIAEKMVGNQLSSQPEPDIVIRMNSSGVKWFFGTTGSPASGQYDFVSVVLHEICHGLGFTGTFNVDASGDGSWGIGNPASAEIFDCFIKSQAGLLLMNTSNFGNPSAELGYALTGGPGKLYFDGPVEKHANNNNHASLYSPVDWSSGSSVYHLDDNQATKNKLMMYSFSPVEVIHNPGPITLGILGDMGWIHTRILHDSLLDIEYVSGPRMVTARILSDTALKKNSIYLHRSTNHFSTGDSMKMVPTGKPNEYSADINIPALGTTVSYYISARDTFDRRYTFPSNSPLRSYSFYAGKDTIKPTIQHQPVPFILNTASSMDIMVNAKDNLGLDTVYIEYRHNNSGALYKGMVHDSMTVYEAKIDLASLNLQNGDSIQYRIVAVDSSMAHNRAFSPASGYYVVAVVNVPAPVKSYFSNFNDLAHDFLFNGFSIQQPTGFSSPGLGSEHPYQSPDRDNAHFDYYAQLRVPIIIDPANAFIRFWEIVLTEPSDAGAVFGSFNFYDYVIAEGSRDGGTSWSYFIPGWTSNSYSDCLAKFNSILDKNGNSTASGVPSLFKRRNIDMLASSKFVPGDTVLIRFRLYSDPYVHGWGWFIDNLGIQDSQADAVTINSTGESLLIYPNPASGDINLVLDLPFEPANLKVELMNLLGNEIQSFALERPGRQIQQRISLDGLSKGIYFAVVTIDDHRIIKKIILQ